jgi:hypothetical protein
VTLKSLQEEFPKWNISKTPGGAWVGRRKRPLVLTNSRIDQGLRDCLIERSENDLQAGLSEQEKIDEELGSTK